MVRCLCAPEDVKEKLAIFNKLFNQETVDIESLKATIGKLQQLLKPLLPPPSLLTPKALVFNQSGKPSQFITKWHGNTLEYYLKPSSEEGKAWKASSLLCKLQLIAWLSLALSFLHDRNILHLDIKPSNILLPVANPQQVKVLEHDTDTAGPKATGPIMLIDFSSAVICGNSKDLTVEDESNKGGIQTTPAYALHKDSESSMYDHDWKYDMYALSLVSWQILLWQSKTENHKWDALRKQIRDASKPYSRFGFFDRTLFHSCDVLKSKLMSYPGTMTKFCQDFFSSNSMEAGITASKVNMCPTASNCRCFVVLSTP